MNRAAVLIGVRDTGELPRLQTVYDGIAMMKAWAESQGIVGDSLVVLTDEHQPVSADKVLDAISALAKTLIYDQLVIYYSGHGLNLGQCEYWLLSNFPQDSRTIINLAASIERARTGTVPHVIFISDACRTPATTIVQQVAAMSGGAMSIFPNPPPGSVGRFKAVDVFYATVLGRPSLEVRDNQDDGRSYRGIYTETLVDALNGKPPMHPDPVPESNTHVIRPWPLREFLDQEVPRRLVTLFPANPPSQMPDAVISSNPSSWLSEIRLSPSAQSIQSVPASEETAELVSLSQFTGHALRTALDQSSPDLNVVFAAAAAKSGKNKETAFFQNLAIAATEPFGCRSFKTKCGLKVQGTKIVEAHSPDAKLKILDKAKSTCEVKQKGANMGATVLLRFDNGMCAILPAIHEFITGLTFDRETAELIDVSFEPVKDSERWDRFVEQWQKLRKLRAIIAASTRMGTFQLSVNDEAKAPKISREMQMEKHIDPSLAVYAAYAYRKQGNRYRLDEMRDYLKRDFKFDLFDVAMLAENLPRNGQALANKVIPLAPMLTQGWSMLDAFGYELPPELANLREHINFNSLWTLYDQGGFDLLKAFILPSKR